MVTQKQGQRDYANKNRGIKKLSKSDRMFSPKTNRKHGVSEKFSKHAPTKHLLRRKIRR